MRQRQKPWSVLAGTLALVGALNAAGPAWGTPGALLWQDRVDVAGGLDGAVMVAVEGRRVVVSGDGTNAAGTLDWLVRAYDASSGALVWQDLHDATGRDDAAQAVAAQGGLVFTGGFVRNAAGRVEALVRAYDARNGELRWQDQFSRAGHPTGVTFQTIAVEGGRLVVGGEANSGPSNPPSFSRVDWFVRAYDARTGTFLWQDFFDGGGFDHAVRLAAAGDLVVASGVTTDAAFVRHFTVRAYDAGSGALRWQDQVPIGNVLFTFYTDVAWQVKIQGDRVVAVGSIGDGAFNIRLGVRTYDAKTGALLWHDLVDNGAGFDVALSVDLNGDAAFVAGFGGAACSVFVFSNCNWLIRAYDQETGALRWQKHVDFAGGDDQVNFVAVHGDRVVVAGVAEIGFARGTYDWVVQVYAAATGELAWEDRVPAPTGGLGFPNHLAVSGNRVFVTGFIQDISGNSDWIVRAHEL